MAIAGAVIGGLATGYAANKAAGAQESAAESAAQVQWDMYNRIRSDLGDYRAGGGNAFTEMQALLGLGGDPNAARRADLMRELETAHERGPNTVRHLQENLAALGPAPDDASRAASQQAAFDRFRASPGYEFRLEEGLKGVERGAAARGGLFSGAGMKGLQRFGEGLASSEYGNYYNQLAGVAGSGQNAAAATGTAGMQTASNVGNAFLARGDAQASGYAGLANAGQQIGGGITNAFMAQQQQQQQPWWMNVGGVGSQGTVSGGGGYPPPSTGSMGYPW